MNRLLQWIAKKWQARIDRIPHGPCTECGKPTTHRNEWNDKEFIHAWCYEIRLQRREEERERREKVNIIKDAILELKKEGKL